MFWQEEVQMTRSSAALAVAVCFLPATVQAQTIEEKAQTCSACHGENGVPQQKDHPVIWGQQLGYLFIELRDFKVGARKNDLMSPIAQGLDPSDLMPLAQYFSQKPWPNLAQPPATGDVAAQAQRINAAIVCTSCHQEGFKGDSVQPRLAGQNHDYLAKTMTDFRTGARANNPGMTDLMKAISESDIAALATYIAGLQL
jgi:cytochrome c553